MLRPAPRTHTRTHALTLTHTWIHAHAAGPRAHRRRRHHRRRCVPGCLFDSAIFFFLFNFQCAFTGLPPPAPGKANTSPGRTFPELLSPPRGRREGTSALLLYPGFPGSRARDPPSRGRGPGAWRGAGAGRGRRRLPARGSTRSLARARDPAWLLPPWPSCLWEGSLLCAPG